MLADGSGSAPKRPRKPTRPRSAASLPVQKAAGLFNPDTALDTSRVSQAPRLVRSPYDPLSTRPNSDDIALSAVAALQQRQSRNYNYNAPTVPTVRQQYSSNSYSEPESPEVPMFSHYAEMMGDTNYGQTTDSVRTYKPMQEDRSTTDTTTADGIKKMIARRLSRRGGAGIVNPISPIAGYEIGEDYDSDFGPRVHPIDGGHRDHTGDDISVPSGTPVRAPVGGVVSSSASTGGAYGNQVIMDHGAGQQTMFGHLSQLAVPPGTKVKKGEIIGYVGTTGYSTGPHLHHEAWVNGEPIDPARPYGDSFNQEALGRTLNQKAHKYAQRHPETLQPVSQPVEGAPEPSDAMISYENRAFKQMPQANDPIDSTPLAQIGDQLARNPQLNALMQAIREQESGGNYGVQNGIGARGAYQIMPSNIDGPGGWDAEALGAEITGEQFLNTPTLQNKIAKFKLKDYFKKYGAEGAAKAWYAGPGNADLDSNGPQYGGPSVNAYADSVLDLMRKYLPNSGQ